MIRDIWKSYAKIVEESVCVCIIDQCGLIQRLRCPDLILKKPNFLTRSIQDKDAVATPPPSLSWTFLRHHNFRETFIVRLSKVLEIDIPILLTF